jgi:hypothetical protein
MTTWDSRRAYSALVSDASEVNPAARRSEGLSPAHVVTMQPARDEITRFSDQLKRQDVGQRERFDIGR